MTAPLNGPSRLAYKRGMRVATWNINDIRKRLPLLLAWLEATQPDVVALQELKCTAEDFPGDDLARLGYRSLVVGQKTWNGVALLCLDREPIEIRRALPGDAADKQARYVEAAVNGVIVASLYLPNGNPVPGPKFDYKIAWFERLLNHARALIKSGHPVVLAGDYNVVPTDEDIYSPVTWRDNALLQDEPRQAYARLLKQGWIDAIARKLSGQRPFTFWDYRRNRWQRDAGLRIDHILLSKSLKPRLADAGIDRAVRGVDGASDHAPVWIELEPAND